MTFTFRAEQATTDTTLPYAERDEYLTGTNGGAHVFDLARAYSFPTQGAPANGALVRDMARDAVDGSIQKLSDTIGWSGNGLDMIASNDQPTGVVMPGSLASLQSAQHFLWCGYYRLPASGAWLKNSLGTLAQEGSARFLFMVGTNEIPALQADEINLIQVGMLSPYSSTPNRQLWFRRGTSTGQNFEGPISITELEAPMVGQFVQLAMWRTATTLYARVKAAGGTSLKSTATGANNTSNFSAKRLTMGRTGSITVADQAIDFRVYRGFIEDLDITGRDPVTVLDADWTRTVARAVYS